MASSRFFNSQPMSIAAQVALMRHHYPHFHCELNKRRRIATWTGVIQPTPASGTYEVRIQYEFKLFPKVWVVNPELITRESGETIPHLYSDDHLCLYLPAKREWTKNMAIATTIVPWTSLWLYHYEIWHATGEWLGGGVHGNPKLEAEEVE